MNPTGDNYKRGKQHRSMASTRRCRQRHRIPPHAHTRTRSRVGVSRPRRAHGHPWGAASTMHRPSHHPRSARAWVGETEKGSIASANSRRRYTAANLGRMRERARLCVKGQRSGIRQRLFCRHTSQSPRQIQAQFELTLPARSQRLWQVFSISQAQTADAYHPLHLTLDRASRASLTPLLAHAFNFTRTQKHTIRARHVPHKRAASHRTSAPWPHPSRTHSHGHHAGAARWGPALPAQHLHARLLRVGEREPEPLAKERVAPQLRVRLLRSLLYGPHVDVCCVSASVCVCGGGEATYAQSSGMIQRK